MTADAGYRGKLSNINLGGDLGIHKSGGAKLPALSAPGQPLRVALKDFRPGYEGDREEAPKAEALGDI